MRLLNFQNLYFKRMASRMGLQDILLYIYMQRPHVGKYKILPNDAFYIKKIEIFSSITLEIKKKIKYWLFVSFGSMFQDFSN